MPPSVDMTAARRLASRLQSKYQDLSREEKMAVVKSFEKDDPVAAEGLRRVWGF